MSQDEIAPVADKKGGRRMSAEVLAAVVAGVIGLVSGIIGVAASSFVFYKIEAQKIAQETARLAQDEKLSASQLIGEPSHLLYEKRLFLGERMAEVGYRCRAVFDEVWHLTDEHEGEAHAYERIRTLVSTDKLTAELDALTSQCQLLGSEALISQFNSLVAAYKALMDDPTHSKATFGIDEWDPLLNAIRVDLGIDPLSEHFLRNLKTAAPHAENEHGQ